MSNNSSNSVETNGIGFVEASFSPIGHAIFGSILVTAIIVGLIANTLGILIFVKNQHLRSPTNLFILSLAICDFLMLVMATPLPTVSSFANHWVWGHSVCVFEGFLVYFLGLTSLYLLTAISIDRFIVISKPLHSSKITKRVAILAICVCYGLGFFWAMLPLVGWNSYHLEGVNTSCSVVWDTSDPVAQSYNIVIFFTCFLFPLCVMCFSYYHVFMTVRNISRNNVWDMTSRVARKNLKIEKRMFKTILLMVGVFLGAWTPYAIVSFWSAFGDASQIPLIVAGAPPILAKTSTIWNPIIYISTNKQFRVAFYRLIPCQSLAEYLKNDEDTPASSKEDTTKASKAILKVNAEPNAGRRKVKPVKNETDSCSHETVMEDLSIYSANANLKRKEKGGKSFEVILMTNAVSKNLQDTADEHKDFNREESENIPLQDLEKSNHANKVAGTSKSNRDLDTEEETKFEINTLDQIEKSNHVIIVKESLEKLKNVDEIKETDM